MIDRRFENLRRLIAVMKSIGPRKDYPRVWAQIDALSYFQGSRVPEHSERQKAVASYLESLPAVLVELKSKTRKPLKRKQYSRLLSTLEEGFPELTATWKYWSKEKEELSALAEDAIQCETEFQQWHSWDKGKAASKNPILVISSVTYGEGKGPAVKAFVAEILRLLPAEVVSSGAYQKLYELLELALVELKEIPFKDERPLRRIELITPLEEALDELQVKSLMAIASD